MSVPAAPPCLTTITWWWKTLIPLPTIPPRQLLLGRLVVVVVVIRQLPGAKALLPRGKAPLIKFSSSRGTIQPNTFLLVARMRSRCELSLFPNSGWSDFPRPYFSPFLWSTPPFIWCLLSFIGVFPLILVLWPPSWLMSSPSLVFANGTITVFTDFWLGPFDLPGPDNLWWWYWLLIFNYISITAHDKMWVYQGLLGS